MIAPDSHKVKLVLGSIIAVRGSQAPEMFTDADAHGSKRRKHEATDLGPDRWG